MAALRYTSANNSAPNVELSGRYSTCRRHDMALKLIQEMFRYNNVLCLKMRQKHTFFKWDESEFYDTLKIILIQKAYIPTTL